MRGPGEFQRLHPKVVQLNELYIPKTDMHDETWTLTALCNDGTIWTKIDTVSAEWRELQPPPGCLNAAGEEQ